MQTKSEQFVKQKEQDWQRFYRLVKLALDTREKSNPDLKSFPKLYRQVCSDLAEARALDLGPDIIEYLNALVGKAHNVLYRIRPVKRSQVKEFIINQFPQTLWRNFIYVLISAALFFIPLISVSILFQNNPDLVDSIIPESMQNQLSSSFSDTPQEDRNASIGVGMASFYIQHNISIALYSFAGGLIFGLGAIYFLVYNGLFLGASYAFAINSGFEGNLIHFITAHSVFELSGLVIAGAAGLLLGVSVLNYHSIRKEKSFTARKNQILQLLSTGVILIFLAAFIEATISPSMLDYSVKVLIAIICGAFMLSVFVILPFIRWIISSRKAVKT